MNCRRWMILAILLYVMLDLSVPAMPGAFVFEPGASLDISSGRPDVNEVDAAPLPAPAGDSDVVTQSPIDLKGRLAATDNPAPPAHLVLSRLPRASLDLVPPSEDPH